MERRYFVTIFAPNRASLRDLGTEGLDVFQATAKENPNGTYSIDGLVTLAQVETLLDGDYEVLIREDASKRARARTETTEFVNWMREMES